MSWFPSSHIFTADLDHIICMLCDYVYVFAFWWYSRFAPPPPKIPTGHNPFVSTHFLESNNALVFTNGWACMLCAQFLCGDRMTKKIPKKCSHIQLQWIKYSYYFGGMESKLIFVIHTFSQKFCDLSSVMYRLFKKKPFSPLIGFKTWMLMLTVHINNEMRKNSNGFRLCQKHWSSVEFFCLKCLHASNALFNNDKEAEQNRLREHKFHHVRSHWVNI